MLERQIIIIRKMTHGPDKDNDKSSSKASSREDEKGGCEKKTTMVGNHRRRFLTAAVATATAMAWNNLEVGGGGGRYDTGVANAACLSGDTSTNCIGVYKVPVDPEIEDFVNTPQKLLLYAPDVKWVPPVEVPKNSAEASKWMKELKVRCEGLEGMVLKGDLEGAGKDVLDITPKVVVAGRVLMEGAKGTSTTAMKFEAAWNSLTVYLGQCDVLLGQGIRGEMGAIALAQLMILESVKEINDSFNDLLQNIP